MLNGLYISAMGLQVQEYRQSVHSNNLANAQTAGFKRAIANVQARANAAYEDPRMQAYRRDPIYGQTNGGAWSQPTALDWSQGTLLSSASKTHLALEGDGFFTLQSADGQKLYTRNGKFSLDSEGALVTDSGNLKVLDADGQEIKLNPAIPVEVNARGDISQSGQKVATLGLATVNDPHGLEPVGNSALRLRDGASAKPSEDATQVKQGYIEQSGVDPLIEMVSMLEGQRAFEANARMITMQDQMLSQLNSVGRVA